jgi:hypothetical protein
VTPLVGRESPPLSALLLSLLLLPVPLSFLLAIVPPLLPPLTPLAPLRSSILSPGLLGWSAIIDLPAAIFESLLRSRLLDVHRESGDPVGARPRPSEPLFDAQASGRNFRARTNRQPVSEIVDFFTSLTCVST